MISVLALTRNEESNLPGCLGSVRWSDDIHVLDSESTDRTVEIARDYGATVTSRKFDNWSSHQNWALRNIKFKYPWVFYLDADERVTPELARSMLAAVQSPGDYVAFEVQRRDFFMGTWLRHVQATHHYMRLFRPECMRYERLVNPISLPSGPFRKVEGYLDHYPFSKGLTHWIDRHNAYSTFEALETIRSGERELASWKKALFAPDFHERRRAQKRIFYTLPGRPILKFLAFYVGRRGFLDGSAGLHYCLLQATYEYSIVQKTKELERAAASRALGSTSLNQT